MRTARGIGLGAGLLVAAMVTVALIAVLYFGWTVIGLPFAPFDVFDWTTRALPGPVIATGISTDGGGDSWVAPRADSRHGQIG